MDIPSTLLATRGKSTWQSKFHLRTCLGILGNASARSVLPRFRTQISTAVQFVRSVLGSRENYGYDRPFRFSPLQYTCQRVLSDVYINTQKLIYIYIYTHKHTYIHTYIHTHTYIYLYIYMYMYIYIYYICICIYNSNTYERSSNFVLHVKKNIYKHIIYICIHIYIYIYVCVCVCVYIELYELFDLNKFSNHWQTRECGHAKEGKADHMRAGVLLISTCPRFFNNRRDRFSLLRAIRAN